MIFWVTAALVLTGSGGTALAWKSDLVSLADPYIRVLDKYTKEEESFSLHQVDTDYRWIATYHSPAFLSAVDELLKKYYPHGFPPYAQQLRSGMESPGQTEFFVAMYAKSLKLQRLLGKKNLWQVQLIAGGKAVQPVSVEQIEINPMHQKIYPYLSKWYKGYRLVFPFDPLLSSQGFELEISGPLGSHRVSFAGI